jgi:hypothetical protein
METSHGINPDYRCISAAVWRRRRILGSQSRVLVTDRVPTLTCESGRPRSRLPKRTYHSLVAQFPRAAFAPLWSEPNSFRFLCPGVSRSLLNAAWSVQIESDFSDWSRDLAPSRFSFRRIALQHIQQKIRNSKFAIANLGARRRSGVSDFAQSLDGHRRSLLIRSADANRARLKV